MQNGPHHHISQKNIVKLYQYWRDSAFERLIGSILVGQPKWKFTNGKLRLLDIASPLFILYGII